MNVCQLCGASGTAPCRTPSRKVARQWHKTRIENATPLGELEHLVVDAADTAPWIVPTDLPAVGAARRAARALDKITQGDDAVLFDTPKNGKGTDELYGVSVFLQALATIGLTSESRFRMNIDDEETDTDDLDDAIVQFRR